MNEERKLQKWRNERSLCLNTFSWLYVENHAVARVLRPSLPLSRLSAVFHERPRRGRGPECMARCCMISQNLPWTSRSILSIKRGWICNFGKDSRNNEKSSKFDVFYRWNKCGLFCRGCESRSVRISRVPAMVSNYSTIIGEIEHLISTLKWMRFPHVFMCFSACGTMQINGNKSTWC